MWAGVLVLFSASIYYELRGGLLAGLVIGLLEAGWIIYTYPGALSQWQPLTVIAAVNMVTGFVLGLAGMRLIRQLRMIYQREMSIREESESKAKQQERTRLQALYQMTETLSTSLDYQVVLDTALDLSAALLEDKSRTPAW